MPNKKISELPDATVPLTGDEYVEIVQDGQNRKVQTSNFAGGSGGVGGTTDPAYVDYTDALADEGVVLTPDESKAIVDLINDLKGAGIWSKFAILYPMVGSDLDAFKYNLKDPRDLDAAFRLTFHGGVTASANGALFNGTSGYAETHFIEASVIPYGALSYGVYSRTNIQDANGVDLGCYNSVTSRATYMRFRNTSDEFIAAYSFSDEVHITGFTDSRRFAIVNRPGVLSVDTMVDNNVINLQDISAANSTDLQLFMGALNINGSASQYAPRQYCFAFISDTLTLIEQTALTNAVNKMQTTLGRNV